MNKIHNNLNIENLIKTEWFEQFNKDQQEEITKGIQDNLDVSIYATSKYSWEQMQEIREGLKDNLNVSIYAKPIFDWNQMEEIRWGLEEKLNVSIYAKPEISWEEMEKIRLDLEESKKRKTNEQNTQQFKHRKLNKNRMV